jgi:hypothetical protein
MRRCALIVAAFAVLFVMVGCSVATAGVTAPAPGPTLTPEDEFVADVLDTPGLSSTVPRDQLIGIGNMICDLIGTDGITRGTLEDTMAQTKFGR